MNNRLRSPPRTAVAMPTQGMDQGIMPNESAQSMSLSQIATMLGARWKTIVIITLSLTVLGAGAIKLMPKTYTARATLIVDTGVKDPLAGPNFAVDMGGNYVSTQIELMTSPIVLVPAIERLQLTQDKTFTAGFSGGSKEALREFVEKNLAAVCWSSAVSAASCCMCQPPTRTRSKRRR